KIMPRLMDAGVKAAPHAWGDPLKVIYSAQLAAGLGNTLMLEGIPSKTYGADMGLYKLSNGILEVPKDAPGFGMKLTEG
ncbi:mandelate racemase, partial [Candidatus Poribacteria bacterium]|nr:mandelate racemase [Candidatus Poribacteria bacterium]